MYSYFIMLWNLKFIYVISRHVIIYYTLYYYEVDVNVLFSMNKY